MAVLHFIGVHKSKLKLSTIIILLDQLSTGNTDIQYAIKAIKRGENALVSHHLEDFSVLDGKYFSGSVLASMKKRSKIEVNCDL